MLTAPAHKSGLTVGGTRVKSMACETIVGNGQEEAVANNLL